MRIHAKSWLVIIDFQYIALLMLNSVIHHDIIR
jgi:hypothetical protein